MKENMEELAKSHGLTGKEYKNIIKVLGREPNITELGIFSAIWSEHCSYKSSKIHLSRLPTKGDHVIYGPGENAGVIDIGDGYAAAFKMESHNHPSFIEPYQGAATGVGGILRDVFTMGARPVALLDSLRFGPLTNDKNKYLLNGVVSGIAGYGNCMGVPTVGGEIYFDECYNGNNLVNAFCLGIVRTDRIFTGLASGVGNPIFYVGSKTGRDGIHGASMASEEFNESSEEKRPTVQVGDPFTEKLLLEACLELMSVDLIVGIQDMGAAGLTSSSCEMADRGNAGVEMDLSKVPLREEGMTPYDIMLSESQERMLIVAKQGKEEEIKQIFRKWDLDVEEIGKVTSDGHLKLLFDGEMVADIPVASMVAEAPSYDRPAQRPEYQSSLNMINEQLLSPQNDMNKLLMTLISSPTIANKEFVYKQYDYMVRTDTVVPPGQDAAVVRVKGTNKGIAMSTGCNSVYCLLDPFLGGAQAVFETARNVVCSGATPMAVTDCLNFANPEKPEIMWQFSQAIDGISAACKKLSIPVVSGNVSFYNETKGQPIYPTPVIGMVGLMDDYRKVTPQYFTAEDNFIVLLGEHADEIGGSEYLKVVHGQVRGEHPKMDFDLEVSVQKTCLEAINAEIINSAHDCAEGGLAIALAESCITGGSSKIGAEIKITNLDEIKDDFLLFGESQSRIILSLDKSNLETLHKIAQTNATPLSVLGTTKGNSLTIDINNETQSENWNRVVNINIDELENEWKYSFEKAATSQ